MVPIPSFKTLPNPSNEIAAHKKWLELLKTVRNIVGEDYSLQEKAAKGFRLKERRLPAEVLGRSYAQYCSLINQLYHVFLTNLQIQKEPYIKEIIAIMMRRLYELRNELVHYIVTDYVYIDQSLAQLRMTPYDIQVVFPYHIPLDSREGLMEQLLQKMWLDAEKRRNAPPKKVKPEPAPARSQTGLELGTDEPLMVEPESESEEEPEPVVSEHTIITEECIQSNIIQKHERARQYFVRAFKKKCREHKMYQVNRAPEAPRKMKHRAASLIQMVYRRYMKAKRQHLLDLKRDMLLGLIPDIYGTKETLKYAEETEKLYSNCRRIRQEIRDRYEKDMERENARLLFFKKDNQIDDITEHIREWFKHWVYGYGFFPIYPWDNEGGTLVVIKGDYPTIEEKIEQDEKDAAATKGKTKEALKKEKEQAKRDAALKAEALADQLKKEREQLFKARCNPFADPGYNPMLSEVDIVEVLQKYSAFWTPFDNLPPELCPEITFGYILSLLTEELMSQIHKDCRVIVDELMRLELKLLIKAQQLMYKRVGWKYPKIKQNRRPKDPPQPKVLNLDDVMLTKFEQIFDLGLVTKPTAKINDIYGDLNFVAYDYNTTDPNASYPFPCVGDIRNRLTLSCAFGCGVQAGATRTKAVMLLGPERNGKSFMVDAVAGEIGAIKIDISPEKLSGKAKRAGKVLLQVFNVARAFQPAVIFCRNIERVFSKKIAPADKPLKPRAIKKVLVKMIKQLQPTDKIILIATCSNPFSAKAKPMVKLFNEVILVPRLDYATIRQFFYYKLQNIRSMPRDYWVQPLSKALQGYGFGFVIELFNTVMNAERIARLNITPLSPFEFMGSLIDENIEPISVEEYKKYYDFWLKNSPLRKERAEYELINENRAIAYQKLSKKDDEPL